MAAANSPCCANWPAVTPTPKSSSTTWASPSPSSRPRPPNPFADLPNVLSLAELDNVAIKISGAGTLSHQPFPYPDIWEPLARIFDAYGLEPLPLGHRLDPRRQAANLRTRRSRLPHHRPPIRLRPRHPDWAEPYPASTTGPRQPNNAPNRRRHTYIKGLPRTIPPATPFHPSTAQDERTGHRYPQLEARPPSSCQPPIIPAIPLSSRQPP